MNRVIAVQQEVEGSTPTGSTCSNDFSDPIYQDIRTQCALSRIIVVSEWRSVIAASLNVLQEESRLKGEQFFHLWDDSF